jgi:hypothetical protein
LITSSTLSLEKDWLSSTRRRATRTHWSQYHGKLTSYLPMRKTARNFASALIAMNYMILSTSNCVFSTRIVYNKLHRIVSIETGRNSHYAAETAQSGSAVLLCQVVHKILLKSQGCSVSLTHSHEKGNQPRPIKQRASMLTDKSFHWLNCYQHFCRQGLPLKPKL